MIALLDIDLERSSLWETTRLAMARATRTPLGGILNAGCRAFCRQVPCKPRVNSVLTKLRLWELPDLSKALVTCEVWLTIPVKQQVRRRRDGVQLQAEVDSALTHWITDSTTRAAKKA